MISRRRFQRCLSLIASFSVTLPSLLSIGCGGSGASSGGSGGGTPPPSNAKEWTWISGNDSAGAASTLNGSYGTEGVASTSNIPAGRDGAVSWIDGSGNLWLFGGGVFDPLGTHGPQNDLWEYDPTSKEWMWVGGCSTSPCNKLGIYGTEGTAASANVPGGRSASVSWVDSDGNLWLFGGDGYDSMGQNYLLNDLWEYSPSTKQWTWVSGNNLVNGTANYGALGVAAATNVPGARQNAVSWKDNNGNFWAVRRRGIRPQRRLRQPQRFMGVQSIQQRMDMDERGKCDQCQGRIRHPGSDCRRQCSRIALQRCFLGRQQRQPLALRWIWLRFDGITIRFERPLGV